MAFDPNKYLAQNTPKEPQGFDPDAYLSQSVEQKEEPGLLKKAGSKALDLGLRGLDYAGGIMRTGAATAGALAKGQNVQEVVPDADVIKAFKGQAPTSAEYLTRLGVPEGTTVDLNPFMEGETSMRDIGGFAADVVTDPLTFVGKSVKAGRALGEATEAGGKKLFKSGLKKIDEKVAEKGAKSFSDLALKKGMSGSTKTIQKQAKKLVQELGPQRDALYKQATKLGAKIDASAITKNADAEIAKLAKDPGLAPVAEKLQEFVNRYKGEGFIDIPTASEWKTNLYEALPESAFGPNGQLKPGAKKVQQALARDFKEAIIKAGDEVEKGLGKKIDDINQAWQTLYSAEKPLTLQVRRATTPNILTSTDPIVGGMGVLAGGVSGGAGMLAAKKLADLSKTTAFRTKAGKGLIGIGKSGTVDPIVRRSLLGIMEDDEDTK